MPYQDLDIDDDGGLPEESQGKLEQTATIEPNPRGHWLVPGEDKPIFENYDDLQEFGQDVWDADNRFKIVIVLNTSGETFIYPEHKHFFVGRQLNNGEIYWRPMLQFFQRLQRDGRAIDDSAYNKFKINAIQLGTFQNIPLWVPDPDFNHNKPDTQVGATTSSTTGTTVVTTTTANPRAAGVVTTSEIIPAQVSTSQSPAVYDDAILRQARNLSNVARSAGPCETAAPPVSQVSSSGASPTPRTTYDDAILRAARASSAAPTSSSIYDDAILRQARSGASAAAAASNGTSAAAAASRGASAAAAAASSGTSAAAATAASASSTVAPRTVTQPTSTPSPSSVTAPTNRSNVYIYEPLTPGFDRYDFNSGKKVFTPDAGPSLNSSAQPATPQSTPRIPPGANRDPNQTGPF